MNALAVYLLTEENRGHWDQVYIYCIPTYHNQSANLFSRVDYSDVSFFSLLYSSKPRWGSPCSKLHVTTTSVTICLSQQNLHVIFDRDDETPKHSLFLPRVS